MKAMTDNPFRRALSGCKMKQQMLANRLHVGERSLGRYLAGELYPPCEVIAKAVEEFELHDLGLYHLSNHCPVARFYFAELQARELAQSVLVMQKRISEYREIQEEIIRIACDGMIDDHERQAWRRIQEQMREITADLISLIAR